MRTPMLAAALLLATAVGALAQVPDYDTEAYCRRVSTDRGQVFKDKLAFCLRTERSAYSSLRSRQGRTRAGRRAHCAFVGSSEPPERTGQGSFGSYVTCLEGRDDAGSNARP